LERGIWKFGSYLGLHCRTTNPVHDFRVATVDDAARGVDPERRRAFDEDQPVPHAIGACWVRGEIQYG
jgi:hypothetical protein